MPVIPKDKSAAYQRWQFGAFDRPKEPASARSAVPRSQAEGSGEIVSNFNLPTAADLERIHSDAQEDGYSTGFESGKQKGYAIGMATARLEAERLGALCGNFQDALATLDQQVADQVLELALEVAKQVVRSTLATQPAHILPIIREAITALPLHHGNIALHLHPADAQFLHAQLGNQIAQFGWHLVEDGDITPGGCKVRAGTSEIDATLEMRWQRVLQTIGNAPATPDS